MRSLLFPIIVFDLAFLPMFHIFGLSYKPSYLIILFLIVATKNSSELLFRGSSRNFITLFLILAAVTFLGAITYMTVYGNPQYAVSIRNIIIYIMAPLAFWVGTRETRPTHNYLIVFLLAYAVVTLVLSVFYQELSAVTKFYQLEDEIASGVYSARSQGLFENANISALFMTLLFMYFVIGIKYAFIRTRAATFFLAIFSTFVTISILQSRNQTVAALVVTVLFLVFLSRTVRLKRIILGVVISVAMVIIISGPLSASLGYDPVARLKNTFAMARDTSSSAHGLRRPIQALDKATERWLASPLFGTGFDSSGESPFEGTQYHNDWLFVWTSAGMIGLLVLTAIVLLLGRIDLILIVPFAFPGMTNSFIFAPSHFLLLMLLAGLAWRRKTMLSAKYLEPSVATSNVSDPR